MFTVSGLLFIFFCRSKRSAGVFFLLPVDMRKGRYCCFGSMSNYCLPVTALRIFFNKSLAKMKSVSF